MFANLLKGANWSSQDRCEEGILKRSPFQLIMNQIKRKKSSVEKGKHQCSSGTRFFRGLHTGKSDGGSKGESERAEIDNSRPYNQNEKQAPWVAGNADTTVMGALEIVLKNECLVLLLARILLFVVDSLFCMCCFLLIKPLSCCAL